MTVEKVKLIECPRDAWQGLKTVIPWAAKAAYLRRLIQAGFRHLDAVSFVSPQRLPQMADSERVMKELLGASPQGSGPSEEELEIIGIVVNEPGIQRALSTAGVTTLGYPYSISARFRRQNANMSLAESRALVAKLVEVAAAAQRQVVIYISMAFGNPWEEPWGPEIVQDALLWLKKLGVRTVSLADTVGSATSQQAADFFRQMKTVVGPDVELGLHLHSRPEEAAEKTIAVYEAGCRRFDSALTGLGGCPFAGDEMVGNLPTEIVASVLAARGAVTGIEPWALLAALEASRELRKEFVGAGLPSTG